LRIRSTLEDLPSVEWFYAKDGQRFGPLSESSLEQRFGMGEIDLNALVWCRGMDEWAPLRVVRSARIGGEPAFNAPAKETQHACAECGDRFADEDLVQIAGRRTCGSCKPVVLQKLREGLLATDTDDACRSGRLIVVGRNGVLPPRCVKCNRQAMEKPQFYRVFLASPTGGFVMLGGLVIASLVEFSSREEIPWLVPFAIVVAALINGGISSARGQGVHVGIGVCAEHARKRFVSGAAIAGLAIGGCLALFLGIVSGEQGWLFLIGCVAVAVGAIAGVLRRNLVTAKKADKTHVWLKGAGSEFLESLPKWPEG
jgi:hypothetical protein